MTSSRLQRAEVSPLSSLGRLVGSPCMNTFKPFTPQCKLPSRERCCLNIAAHSGGGGGVHGGKENQLAGPDEWDSWRKRLPCRQTCLCLTEGRGGCCLATVAAQGQAGRGQASDQEGGTVGMFQDGAQQLAPRAGGRKGSSQPKTQFL